MYENFHADVVRRFKPVHGRPVMAFVPANPVRGPALHCGAFRGYGVCRPGHGKSRFPSSSARRPRFPPAPRCMLSESEWEDILGSPPSGHDKFLDFAKTPRSYVSVSPLAHNGETAYCSDASEKLALPAPLSGNGGLDAVFFSAAVAKQHGNDMPGAGQPGRVLAGEARFLLLRADFFLREVFNGGEEDADELIRRANERVRAQADYEAGGFDSPLDVLACALRVSGRQLLCASIEESVGCADGCVSVCGCVYVGQAAVLANELVPVGEVTRIEVSSPIFAVAVAAGLSLPCHVARYLFDATAVYVSVHVKGPDGEVVVEESVSGYGGSESDSDESRPHGSSASWSTPSGPSGSLAEDTNSSLVGADGEELIIQPPWVTDFRTALALSDDVLRFSLKSVGIAVTTTESRVTLLRKYAENMDEVERRELLIQLAADADLFALAGKLQAGRSERGNVVHQMREAEARGDWDEMFRLKVEADRMKDAVADTTQDPGSYDPYLDADPWYRPNR